MAEFVRPMPDIAGTLMAMRQMKRQEAADTRANALHDLQLKRETMALAELEKRQAQDNDIRIKLANLRPETTTSVTPRPYEPSVANLNDLVAPNRYVQNLPQRPLTGSLESEMTGNGLATSPVSAAGFSLPSPTASPLVQAYNEGRVQSKVTQPDYAGTAADEYMKQGRLAEAVQSINLSDSLAQYGAKVSAGQGDIREYYKAKAQIDRMKEIGETLNKFKGAQRKAIWPQLVKAYPELGKVNPDEIMETAEGIAYPYKTPDGQPVQGLYYVYDSKGEIQVKEVKEPRSDYKQRTRNIGDKEVFEESQDGGRTWGKVSEAPRYKPSSGGGTTIVQSTFVDPKSGKPLIFDKATGTYKVAEVSGDGGVVPKPAAYTPESAAKAQLVEQGLSYMPEIRKGFLGDDPKNPKLAWGKVAASETRMPFTEGRRLNTLVLDAVEAKLRAESGAAVPEPEVTRAAKRFIPQVGDNLATVQTKLNNLEAFLSGTQAKINTGRTQGGKPAEKASKPKTWAELKAAKGY